MDSNPARNNIIRYMAFRKNMTVNAVKAKERVGSEGKDAYRVAMHVKGENG